MKTIRQGSTGQEVRVAQYLLGVDADGIFGPLTKVAAETFQRAHNISVDGIIGPATWAKLAGAQPTIRRGSTGNAVRALQLILGIACDGIFGPKTGAAVVAYQSTHGLAADGVAGPMTWNALLVGIKASGGTQNVRPMDYKQYDSRWASVMYSNHNDKGQTIKNSGCGPTAMANIIATWFDPTVTPVDMCQLAVQLGCRTYNDGTSWAYFDKVAGMWPFGGYQRSGNTSAAIDALGKGALVVALMGKGYWTNAGHYITLWDCDGANTYACDPGSSTRKQSSIDIFRAQSRQYFIFFK